MLRWDVIVSIFALLCIRASAQSVISAHSGLIHFFEGAISIDGRAVPPINGRFAEIPEGALLNTNEGKAEILLGPETFLWLGPNSAIRMQRNSLAEARVELIEGSAVVQSIELPPGNAVTLIQKDSQVRLSAQSLYRLDAHLSQLTVRRGQAGVSTGQESLVVNAPCRLAFSSGLITPLPKGEVDGLEQWVQERQRAIAAANLVRARMEESANPAKKRPRRHGHAYPGVMVPVPRRAW